MKRFFILLALLTFAIAAQAQDITVGLISGLYGDAEAAFVRLKEAGFKACQTGYSLEWNEDTAKEFKRLKKFFDDNIVFDVIKLTCVHVLFNVCRTAEHSRVSKLVKLIGAYCLELHTAFKHSYIVWTACRNGNACARERNF